METDLYVNGSESWFSVSNDFAYYETGTMKNDKISIPRSLAERTEAMFRSVDPDGSIAQEWKRIISDNAPDAFVCDEKRGYRCDNQCSVCAEGEKRDAKAKR